MSQTGCRRQPVCAHDHNNRATCARDSCRRTVQYRPTPTPRPMVKKRNTRYLAPGALVSSREKSRQAVQAERGWTRGAGSTLSSPSIKEYISASGHTNARRGIRNPDVLVGRELPALCPPASVQHLLLVAAVAVRTALPSCTFERGIRCQRGMGRLFSRRTRSSA
ncbi:hypothetical protein OH76DRAFT_444905 [Lentinus brumalis]|uniref:Uncharacterized protein n=1 Tax=Lentinus brumalis TaxID=2498619 RepID=A0A371DCZ6_9APHY|nr:hypothetical protein OH76DRAFT_444905 [Polyporus brumalis]